MVITILVVELRHSQWPGISAVNLLHTLLYPQSAQLEVKE